MEKRAQKTLEETMEAFGVGEQERPKKQDEYKQQAQKKLDAFLKATLKPEQIKRLREIGLQQEGWFAVGQPDVAKELGMTAEQTKQFMGVFQEMQKKIEPLFKEAQSGGNPQEIMPKVMKVRKEHEGKIEGLLTDAQKKQWQEMLGKPLNLDD